MRPMLIVAGLVLLAGSAFAETPTETLERIFARVPDELASSGILYDRALPLSGITQLDGSIDEFENAQKRDVKRFDSITIDV